MASFQSNEEIIENLTKNLSKSFIEPETHTESSSSSVNNQHDDSVTEEDRLSVEDETENKTTDNSEENEDDSIDEASLQDRDAQLSSEDKEVSHLLHRFVILVIVLTYGNSSEFHERSIKI